jgi:hypothetical protein
MSDYTKYLLRQLGIKESSLKKLKLNEDELDAEKGNETGVPNFQKMLSPTARATPVIAVAIRGSSTGGLPSGADQTGISPTTPTGRLGGYEPIPSAKDNSLVVDKTPSNSAINSSSPINNNSPTEEDPHPHQIQKDVGEPPQAVTGASTDSDDSLTLKSTVPKGVDIDVAEDEKNPHDSNMDGEESMEDQEKNKQGLNEGKHKPGCQCGFCKNKGGFGKKKDSKDKDDKEEKDEKKDSKDKEDKKNKKLDETFSRHIVLMNEYLGVGEGEDEENHADNPEFQKKDAEQFRKDRSASPEGDLVRKDLGMSEDKWMQDVSKGAEKKGTKGALHKDLGVPQDQKIPTDRLNSLQAMLHQKSKRGSLTDKELTLSRRVNAALNMRNANK